MYRKGICLWKRGRLGAAEKVLRAELKVCCQTWVVYMVGNCRVLPERGR